MSDTKGDTMTMSDTISDTITMSDTMSCTMILHGKIGGGLIFEKCILEREQRSELSMRGSCRWGVTVTRQS